MTVSCQLWKPNSIVVNIAQNTVLSTNTLLWKHENENISIVYIYIYIYIYNPIFFQLSKILPFSWIKRDQLDVTFFIISLHNAQHVSDVNTSILRSLRLMCWVISWVVLLWFDVCWCYVVFWLWWCGIRMQTEALSASACIRTTHIEPEQYNPWNNSTNKSQAPEDGRINNRNMLSIK